MVMIKARKASGYDKGQEWEWLSQGRGRGHE